MSLGLWPVLIVAEDERVGYARDQARLQPIVQCAHARRVAAHSRRGDLGRLAEADDPRRVLGSAAPAAFLVAAENQRAERNVAPDIERADAFPMARRGVEAATLRPPEKR